MRLFLTLIAFLLCNTPGISQTIITGKLMGADGQPMVYADITQVSNRSRFPRPRVKSFPVNENGEFSFQVEAPNLYRFWFSGAYHQDFELPVYVSGKDTIHLNVQLEPYHIINESQEILISIVRGWKDGVGNVPDYEYFRVNPDSLGNYDLKWQTNADTVAYKLDYITKEKRRMHGTQFDYLHPHRENNYYSVIKTPSTDSVTISVNLSDYPVFKSTAPDHEFLDAPKETRQFDKANRDYEKRYAIYREFNEKQREAGKESYEFEYDWDDDLLDFYKKAKNERDPFLRKTYLTFFMEIDFSKYWGNRKGYSYDKEFAEQVLEDFGPVSPLWSYATYNLSKVLGKAIESDKVYDENEKDFRELKEMGSKYSNWIQAYVEEHPDSTLHGSRLSLGISWAFKYKQFELFEEYYTRFMDLYGDTRRGERVRQRYNPNKRIAEGKEVPNFEFTLLDSKETVSSQSMLGTRYLINFWATWCAPCYKKMDDLHKIYDAFEDQGFEILNISMNFKKEHLYDFREKKYPMPFLNVHVGNRNPDKPPLKDFEVISIPKTILVDENGIIEAVNPDRDALVRLLKSK